MSQERESHTKGRSVPSLNMQITYVHQLRECHVKYSLPPSKRLVMTLTAKDNRACLYYCTALKILWTSWRVQEKNKPRNKYRKKKITTLKIKIRKNVKKKANICQILKYACKMFTGTDFPSGKVLLSKCLGHTCRARKRVFSLFQAMLRGQWYQI